MGETTLVHPAHCGGGGGVPLQHTPVSLSVLDVALDGAVISGVGYQ